VAISTPIGYVKKSRWVRFLAMRFKTQEIATSRQEAKRDVRDGMELAAFANSSFEIKFIGLRSQHHPGNPVRIQPGMAFALDRIPHLRTPLLWSKLALSVSFAGWVAGRLSGTE
jgi:hypothetical protein